MRENNTLTALEDGEEMREEYDFTSAIKNPYAKRIKKQVTIKLAPSVIDYFKKEAVDTGIPYQTLINLYLLDCVKEKKKIQIDWRPDPAPVN